MGSKKLEAAMPAPSHDKGEPDEWEVKDAASTLTRAEEIKKNKKLMPHVRKHINKQITSLQDLKQLASKKKLEEQGYSQPGADADGDND